MTTTSRLERKMTIHTQVDQGVFVLTLKPGKDTP